MILAPIGLKTAGFLVLAAVSPSPPAPACPNIIAPQIGVEIVVARPIIHHEQTIAQMKLAQTDTPVPYQMKQLDHAARGGMIQDDIGIDYNIVTSEVPGNTAQTINMHCVKYDSVQVRLTLMPTIFIAKDYDENSCWYRETYQHEMSHVDMDRVVMEKYKGRLQDGLALAFSGPQDSVQGPVKKSGIKDLKKKMGEQLVSMTNSLLSDMVRERMENQQGVDSIENYAYIMNQCYHGTNVVKVKP